MNENGACQNPTLYSTIKGMEDFPTLFTPLSHKIVRNYDKGKRNYDYNVLVTQYPNVIVNYDNYYVLYVQLPREKTAEDESVGVVLNRMGDYFYQCFYTYFGFNLCKYVVQQVRMYFEQRVKYYYPDIYVFDSILAMLRMYASYLSYKPQLLIEPAKTAFYGKWDEEIGGVAYEIINNTHYIKFYYEEADHVGHVVSGFLSAPADGLHAILYTGPVIYKLVDSEKLGIAFINEQLIGFVW